MSFCSKCGKAVEFATIDGLVRPLHNCSATDVRLFHLFDRPAHYCNPNARCPVCSKPVVYYQNARGSRIFFDCLGVPWDKHPCTDNNLPVYAFYPEELKLSAKNRLGEELDFFRCTEVRGYYKEDGFRRTFFSLRIKSEKGFENEYFCLGGQEGVNWNSLTTAAGFFRRVIDRSRRNFTMYFLNREIDNFSHAKFSRDSVLSARLRRL